MTRPDGNIANRPARRHALRCEAHIDAAWEALARKDVTEARKHAEQAAQLAEQVQTTKHLRRTAQLLQGLCLWGEAARLMRMDEPVNDPDGLPEWDGRPAPHANLLIAKRDVEHIGRPIRFGRLLPIAAARVKRCIVPVDPRLLELLRRSFPMIDFRARGADDDAAYPEADLVAGYHTLIRHLAFDDETVREGFSPLRADPAVVRDMKSRYGKTGRPVIGISWMSTNKKKEVPALDHWAEFMRGRDATYVSLQYGDVAADVASLRQMSGCELIHDETVDSYNDLDRHAAQISAMDAVVTISSTCSHMSGALGMRTFVPLHETTRLYWPALGRTVSWYPATTFYRTPGEAWKPTFDQIALELDRFLSSG